jgi:hypothetical protein
MAAAVVEAVGLQSEESFTDVQLLWRKVYEK